MEKIAPYTDKKENLIFLKYKEIQSGVVAKSYMRRGFLIRIWGNAQLFPHIWGGRPLVIYDFATAPSWISLNMRKNLIFFFISVQHASRNGSALKIHRKRTRSDSNRSEQDCGRRGAERRWTDDLDPANMEERRRRRRMVWRKTTAERTILQHSRRR